MSRAVCFSHGKESGPWGTKINALAEVAKRRGWEVESLDYRGMDDPAERIQHLIDWAAASGNEELVLAGSSMGGAVVAAAANTIKPQAVFLMATAVYVPGYEHLNPEPPHCPVTMVHGWRDEIIPWENGLRFAIESKARYHLIDGDHGLGAEVPILETMFDVFLQENE